MKFHLNIKPVMEKLRRVKKQTWLIIGGAALFLLIIFLVTIPGSIHIARVRTQRGEFIIDINITGEIDALNSTNISIPRMRHRMSLQIVDMVDEGTIVKKGDFLLQLDPSEAQQKVDDAKDELVNTKAQLESEKATIASNMAQLESQLEIEKYNHEQAKLNLKMMQFEAKVRKQEYELNMKKAEVALAQAKERITSQKIIDKATLMKAELKVRQAEVALKEAQQALSKLTIKAPIDGLVVYKEIWSGSTMKKVQVGDTPWPGFPVIGIPDLSIMQARTTVNEVDINKVKKEQNAVITVDALEGKVYYGKITRIAALARREKSTNTKVFDVEITIDSTDGQLRPGMTCGCRIITDRIKDALFVPLQAVFQKEGQTLVYVMSSRTPKKRVVKVGQKNSNYIIIKEGLKEGESVCLRDPTISLEEIGGETQPAVTTPKTTRKKTTTKGTFIIR